jgi:hypothetical protein
MTRPGWKNVVFHLTGTPGYPMTVRIAFLAALVVGMDVLFWATPRMAWGVYASIVGIVSGAVLAGYGLIAAFMTFRADTPKTDRLFHALIAIVGALFGAVSLLVFVGIWGAVLSVRLELERLL